MFTLPIPGKRALIPAKSVLVIPVLLLLIAPVINSNLPMMQIFFVKYYWLTCIAVFMVPLLIAPAQNLPVTWADLLVMLFTVYIYGRSFLSAVPDTDHRKINSFLIAVLAYFAVKRVLPAGGKQHVLLGLLAMVFLTTIVTCVYGILQKAGLIPPFNPDFPVTGTFYQPAALGGFIAGVFPVACYSGYMLGKHDSSTLLVPVVRIMAVVTAGVIIFILPSVHSRAAVIGLTAGVIFTAASIDECKSFIGRMISKGRYWKSLLIAMVLLVLVAGGYRVRTSSADGRLLVWKISGKMILDKPLWGFGTDAFRYIYPGYQIAYFKSGKGTSHEELLSCEVIAPFNEVIQCCCEWGIIGLLLFLSIVITVFRKAGAQVKVADASYSMESMVRTEARAALVGWLVFSQFSYTFALPELTVYIFVFLALSDSRMAAFPLHEGKQTLRRLCTVFTALVSLAFVIQLGPTCKTWQGVREWDMADRVTDSVSAHNSFLEALPLLKNNDYFLSDFAHHSFKQGWYNESIQAIQMRRGKFYRDLLLAGETYEQLAMPDSAIVYYKEASFLLPHRFTPLYKLMRLYNNRGDTAAAITTAKEILTKQVKIESYEVYTIKQEANRFLHGTD